MGILSFFGKGPLSPSQIDKAAKLACNPFAQPDVRMREMQRLLNDGQPEALRGVLKRLGCNASGSIADEDEKKWLEDALVEHGEPACEPLKSYIRTEKQLTYALMAFQRLVGKQKAIAFFIEVLKNYGFEDHRSGEAKLQLILALAELLPEPSIIPALNEFILDHSDEVRWAVMNILENAAKNDLLTEVDRAEACRRLGQVVCDSNVGPRIQNRAAEILCEQNWPLPDELGLMASQLEEFYFVDKKKFVRRRAKKRI